MKKSNEQTLGAAIREFLKNYRLEEKVTETRITASWEKVMGRNIACYTEKIVLKNNILTVYLRSSVLRNELSMAKTKIMDMLNKEAGQQVIKEIIFR